jgi:hypothetical protein
MVIANMSASDLNLAGWRLLVDGEISFPLPAQVLKPGEPLSLPMPAGALNDQGGLLSLIDNRTLKVDGEAYLGGDGTKGWSTSFG